MRINWKVRFNRNNAAFVISFIGALLVPIMTYFGINYQNLDTWAAVGDLAVKFISNPYLIALTIINAVFIIPDPTTKGISDSDQAMRYRNPKER